MIVKAALQTLKSALIVGFFLLIYGGYLIYSFGWEVFSSKIVPEYLTLSAQSAAVVVPVIFILFLVEQKWPHLTD